MRRCALGPKVRQETSSVSLYQPKPRPKRGSSLQAARHVMFQFEALSSMMCPYIPPEEPTSEPTLAGITGTNRRDRAFNRQEALCHVP